MGNGQHTLPSSGVNPGVGRWPGFAKGSALEPEGLDGLLHDVLADGQ